MLASCSQRKATSRLTFQLERLNRLYSNLTMALAKDGIDVELRRMKQIWGTETTTRFLKAARDHVTRINKLNPASCLNTNPSGLQGAVEAYVLPRLAMSLFENGQQSLPPGIRADVSLWTRGSLTRSNLASSMGSATGTAEAGTQKCLSKVQI